MTPEMLELIRRMKAAGIDVDGKAWQEQGERTVTLNRAKNMQGMLKQLEKLTQQQIQRDVAKRDQAQALYNQMKHGGGS